MSKEIMKRLLITMTLMSFGCSAGPPSTHADLLDIADVTPGMLLPDVVQKLGRPVSQKPANGSFSKYLSYEGLVIGFDEDSRVVEITTKSKEYCFNKKTCPGMRFSKAQKIIPGIARQSADGPYVYSAKNNDDGCWLEVLQNADVILSLSIKCQP